MEVQGGPKDASCQESSPVNVGDLVVIDSKVIRVNGIRRGIWPERGIWPPRWIHRVRGHTLIEHPEWDSGWVDASSVLKLSQAEIADVEEEKYKDWLISHRENNGVGSAPCPICYGSRVLLRDPCPLCVDTEPPVSRLTQAHECGEVEELRAWAYNQRQANAAPSPPKISPARKAHAPVSNDSTRISRPPGLTHVDKCFVGAPAKQEDADAFVREMRRQGDRNWVCHSGQGIRYVVNLADPSDTDGLDPEVLVQLMEQAATAPVGPLVPLQPWEADKLQSVATQVVNALEGGRYSKDFGEMLTAQLKGWVGAEEWAQAEAAWVCSLVAADDPESRDELRRWLEGSLCSTLREVQKAVNSGQLSGTGAVDRSSAAKPHPKPAANSSVTENPLANSSATENPLMDAREEAALQEALRASLEDQSDDDDDDCDQGHAFNCVAEVDEDQEEYSTNEPISCFDAPDAGTWAERRDLGSGSMTQPTAVGSTACEHVCGLNGGCCICVTRAPRLGVVPNLCNWWQQRGIASTQIVSYRWRFFCSHCEARSSIDAADNMELPLPFGGKLVRAEGLTVVEEIVEPSCEVGANDGDWSQADLSSLSGSWVVVQQPGLKRTPSAGSWVLPDVNG